MENFIKLDKNKLILDTSTENNNHIDYKQKYFALIREISKVPNEMCDKCPLVKSCCNGCEMLKRKVNKLKRDPKWGLTQD